jgi:hypothetical protein
VKTGKFLSNFVKTKDVTKPVVVTITTVETQTFEDKEKGTSRDSLVVYTKELEQGVVLCKASIMQLMELCGSDETDEWVGKKVTLFADPTVQYMGKRIGGIRFKAA